MAPTPPGSLRGPCHTADQQARAGAPRRTCGDGVEISSCGVHETPMRALRATTAAPSDPARQGHHGGMTAQPLSGETDAEARTRHLAWLNNQTALRPARIRETYEQHGRGVWQAIYGDDPAFTSGPGQPPRLPPGRGVRPGGSVRRGHPGPPQDRHLYGPHHRRGTGVARRLLTVRTPTRARLPGSGRTASPRTVVMTCRRS